ncbi:MAG: hypothetical protein KJ601_02125 [Nanoarchaeota archaeon]|nr:hypothetical protein [Nanoarchaeota archaeon]MBU1704944.1 hypothetical protein [Nanoarchaeota archaeon]
MEDIDDIKEEKDVDKQKCKICGKDPGEDGLCAGCGCCSECCECGEK